MNGDGWDGKNQLILMHGNGEVLYNAFMHVVIKVENAVSAVPEEVYHAGSTGNLEMGLVSHSPQKSTRIFQRTGDVGRRSASTHRKDAPNARSGRAAGVLREVPGMDAHALAAEI